MPVVANSTFPTESLDNSSFDLVPQTVRVDDRATLEYAMHIVCDSLRTTHYIRA